MSLRVNLAKRHLLDSCIREPSHFPIEFGAKGKKLSQA